MGKIAGKLLDFLDEALEAGYIAAREFGDIKGKFIADWETFTEEQEWLQKKAKKRKLIYELKRRKLIKEKEIGDRLSYFLTDKGAAMLERYKILNCKTLLPKTRVCVVIFDIPESQRHIRALFRRFLKDVGFIYLQQSVWTTNKDILEPLKILLVVYRLNNG